MDVIVTGSFDPITIGHMEIIKYASEKYHKVYVVALINSEKEYMFTMEQKKQLIELATQDYSNVVADYYCGMTADYMHQKGIRKIVRGIRGQEDLSYEKMLASEMKKLDNDFETEFFECEAKYSQISSTMVREKIKNGESLDGVVPSSTLSVIKDFLKQ